ncbi:GyrI-like domain-containing protein [Fodinibius sediminis]|uniref:Predicted transcriptional regulator YdeE, contains AraC-type DNA-binding domain n=1 Tax=Fodinibius sediminis TaxID=1214077 RepID=A0A521BFX9_9BACT|nr:effector binding domain-containing protein [Fodinibius sediminis]SMO45959.1 Predicted transcriptional regulator YdeE, contains AraC-type DNA-binding domain [Fodinibius sediminis]
MDNKTADHITVTPVQIIDNYKPMLIAGLSREYPSCGPFEVTSLWDEFNRLLLRLPIPNKDITYGLCSDPGAEGGLEYTCGVEISGNWDLPSLPNHISIKQLASHAYAIFEHRGSVTDIRTTCDAIYKEWIPQTEYTTSPEDIDFFFERYGREFDPRRGKGDIQIWIPINTGPGLS